LSILFSKKARKSKHKKVPSAIFHANDTVNLPVFRFFTVCQSPSQTINPFIISFLNPPNIFG